MVGTKDEPQAPREQRPPFLQRDSVRSWLRSPGQGAGTEGHQAGSTSSHTPEGQCGRLRELTARELCLRRGGWEWGVGRCLQPH